MPNSTQGKMVGGAAWMVLFKMVERSLGFVSILILARLLSPEDFGLIAMAMSFIFVAELMTAFGFDVALIQNQSATDKHYHAAWTCNVLFGLAIFLLVIGAASPIAAFYGEPSLFWVVCVLALCPLIGGCENIGVVAFRKELKFRSEFLFQVSRKFVGFIVVVPLAIWLRNYWALVAGMLASKLAGTVISYFVHPFRPHFSLAGGGRLFSFSKWLLLSNVLGFLKQRLTDFVIGRSQGAASLGTYNVAYELANLPTSELGAPINRALLPGFAKLGNAPGQLLPTYISAIGLLALLALPAAAGVGALSDYIVPVALGMKWAEAVPLMQILAIFGAVELFHSSMCAVLIASGRPHAVVRANAVFVFMLIVLLSALVEKYGTTGAALSIVGASILSTPAFLMEIKACTGIGPLTFLRAVARPLAASVVMFVFLHVTFPAYDKSMGVTESVGLLFSAVFSGAVVYAFAATLLWIAARRPQSAEKAVLDRARSMIRTRIGAQTTHPR